jgi:transcription termination/antitermination protein NusG
MTGERQLDPGDTVRLLKGGYRGFVGAVSRYEPDTERLVVTISVFGRQTAIQVDPEWVEKVG